ncbi:MAG: hypothetical protein ACI92G_004798, partial [Candidatus Pelagisphaera sp.]
ETRRLRGEWVVGLGSRRLLEEGKERWSTERSDT